MGRFLWLVIGLFVIAGPAAGGQDDPSIFGRWRAPEWRAEVVIYPCGASLCGDLVALPDDAPKTDVNNPDPAAKARKLLGLRLIEDFRRVDAAGHTWVGGGEQGRRPGRIYVPTNGDTLGDAENAYVIRLEGIDMLTIGIRNCLLSCLVKSTWIRVRDK